ncbi:MAG: hypothetical protein M0006_05925 [Magnetospirillum sp.]|nr:hypothetical protein [Magnetospirillum sp.]
MAVPMLPPPVDIDGDTKKAIIDGLKKVLAKFQHAGFLDGSVTYLDIISNPRVLTEFIQVFAAHRDAADDVVRSKDGSGPVRDDDALLVCGVSLNQIQHLLVRTCAKKVCELDRPVETVTEPVAKKSFLFFRKTRKVEVQRPAHDPVEDRKIREIVRNVAFVWQLPLLDAYRRHLTYQHLIEIGEALVALPTEDAVAAVARFEPALLRKVKEATGADFPEILADRPEAIGGIAVWNREMYDFYRKLLGDKAWAFFARDKAFFNVVAALDKATARVFGDVLCYIASENLEEVQRLNIDKSEVLIAALRAALGPKLPMVLSAPSFSRDMLRKVVDNLLHMTQEKDKLLASFTLTCKAMVPSILEWLARQPRAA